MAVEVSLRELIHDALTEPLAKLEGSLDFARHFLASQLARFAKPHNQRHGKSSGSHAAFVTSAIDLRFESHSRVLLANVKCTHSFRSINLVSTQTEEVYP